MATRLKVETTPLPAPTPTFGAGRVTVSLTVWCGCGHRALTIEEAVAHSEATGHSLDITGRVVGVRKPRL